jgi:hypothetical protein
VQLILLSTQPPAPEATWSIGTMMLKLGVDPDLLGWDAEAEDWVEVDV